MSLLQNIICFIGLLWKETYNLIDPTNRSHPISIFSTIVSYSLRSYLYCLGLYPYSLPTIPWHLLSGVCIFWHPTYSHTLCIVCIFWHPTYSHTLCIVCIFWHPTYSHTLRIVCIFWHPTYSHALCIVCIFWHPTYSHTLRTQKQVTWYRIYILYRLYLYSLRLYL